MNREELQRYHRIFAVEAFNSCWELIDLPSRTPEQDQEMIRRAEVSFWHWMKFENHTSENTAIGYWQLARVYALAGRPETALSYAEKNLEISRAENLGAFCEGYALEALARAHAVAGDFQASRDALSKAREVASRISEADDRQRLEADLLGIPNQA